VYLVHHASPRRIQGAPKVGGLAGMLHKVRIYSRTVGEVLSLVWSQADPFVKVRLLIALLLLIAMSFLTAAGPLALKFVVDALDSPSVNPALPVTILVTAYVLSQWLARSIGEIRGLVYARAERRMFRTLSERLFAHVMRLPLRFHLERQTGAINQTLVNGLEGYQMIVHHLVFTFLPLLVELGTTSVILIGLRQPIYFVLFAGALACYMVAFTIAAFRVASAANQASSAHIDAAASITDGMIALETIKFYAAEEIVQQRVSKALIRTETEWINFYRRYAMNGLAVSAIFGGFLLATILVAARQVQAGQLTIGGFVLVNTYMLQLTRPVEMLGYAMQAFSQGTAMLTKMLELLHQVPEPLQESDSRLTSGPGELRFRNVSFSYSSDRLILNDLTFTVPPARTLGIVGVSGGGKSTIVRLLVRLLEPTDGRILLDGEPISELSLEKLRQSIAVVPQDTVLFDDTLLFNIGFGKPGSTFEEIQDAARRAHLHEFIDRLPEGYATRVGERGVKLSGGERQRVAIARAALKNPRIYVYDEATSSLDSRTEHEILENLREISKSSTTFIIAHRLSTVVHADEIVVLDNGSIVERGSHAALLKESGRYAELWRAQQEGFSASGEKQIVRT
jgi:ABC-type transport system involved in Fe-S cluster assembly fused permease/ATPase subunit